MARTLCIAAALAALIAGCGGDDSSKEAAKPPSNATANAKDESFLGIYADDVFFGDVAYKRQQLARQRKAGIELIRQPFAWDEFEKNPARFDEFVAETARAGIAVLPTVLGPEPGAGPSGGTHGPMKPPPDNAAYARYMTALIDRYGPKGSFWSEHSDLPPKPIRSWQVWNEPNIGAFWGGKPDPRAYAELLKTAAAAIRKADPDAEVVTAGLPTSHLGIPGAEFAPALDGGTYDTIAVHPYAPTPDAVVKRVDAIRRVAPGKKVWVTEVGWGTGGKPGPLTVSEQKQAEYIAETVKRLRVEKVRGVVVFQWRDPKPFPGRRPIWPYYAGLLHEDGAPKPALAALAAVATSTGH
jgi:hypothetical protein